MDRFVVGTGRCGSTLLSRMLGVCPRVLSVFEFFNGLEMTRRFRSEPVPGAEFAELLAKEHPFVTMVLRRGYSVPEIVYPFGPGARYGPDDGLPYLLVAALPRMTDDPDALFDATLAFARALPVQPPRDHHRALFEWWTRRLGREVWIERSGSSIDYVESLHALFPEARFLHLHRDGREVALSMREHHAYRLAVSLMHRVESEAGPSLEELATLDPAAAPTPDDPVSRLLRARPSAEPFGRYWSDQMERGLAALRQLPAERVHTVRFEDLVRHPAEVLRGVAEFFALGPEREGWIARAAALVRGVPPTRFEKLPATEQQRLAEACVPGERALAAAA